MPHRQWLERLQVELKRQRIPGWYRRRLADELRDHLSDLLEDRSTMETTDREGLERRVGSPEEVAGAAARAYRAVGFAGRYRWVTFLAAPVLAAILLQVVFWAGVIGLAWGGDAAGVAGTSPAAAWGARIAEQTSRFLPFAAAAGAFCWLARRHALGVRWALAACGVVALLAAAYHTTLVLPTTPGTGRLMLGLGYWPGRAQWAQAAAPLAVGVAFVCWSWRARACLS